MPAAAPPIPPHGLEHLVRLGAGLRLVRKQQKVSALAAAESAGISRVTLHRIERGEPSVAVGSWIAVASALGLSLELRDSKTLPATPELPERVRLEEYPQLRQLAWQLKGVEELTPREALELYERNWRYVDAPSLSAKESALINVLSNALGAGRLLV